MYRRYSDTAAAALLDKDRGKCKVISTIVILQCILVFIGSTTILRCKWNPDYGTTDFNKLARIMYLYDSEACGHVVKKAKAMVNIQFSNDTFGLPILPIQWQPALVTMSTRLSAKTIHYIDLSLSFHVTWLILAIALRIFTRPSTGIKMVNFFLGLFFHGNLFIVFFDLSMAIVYVTHIRQSLTKGMVLRYSGWSGRVNLTSLDDFAGWLPITAAICWLKGIFVFCMNVYFCKVISRIRKKTQRREATKNILKEGNQPIPEAVSVQRASEQVLVYRTGEKKPYVSNTIF